jgi:hypothetical protein
MLSVVTNILLVVLVIFVVFAAVGFVSLWLVGRTKIKGLAEHDKRRLHALPFMGDGPIPAERDRTVDDDTASFTAVLKLFLRAWPYIKPQVFGRWYTPGGGLATEMADDLGGNGYSFWYAAVLATLAATLPFVVGAMPRTIDFPLVLLYPCIAVMVLAAWPVAFSRGRIQTIATTTLVAAAFLANILATLVIEGIADGIYAAGVTLSCAMGWLFQFKIDERVVVRIRLHAHLVYFYFVDFLQRFIGSCSVSCWWIFSIRRSSSQKFLAI